MYICSNTSAKSSQTVLMRCWDVSAAMLCEGVTPNITSSVRSAA